MIGDTNARNFSRSAVRPLKGFPDDSVDGIEDFTRVVLDPSRLWKILAEFPIGGSPDTPQRIVEDGPAPGGSLIDCKDEGRGSGHSG